MSHRYSIVPHNVRVEEALLGCALIGAYNDLCVQGVTRNWFNDLLHQAVWDMMEAHVGKDPVSLESISIAAKTDKAFQECGGTVLTLTGMADEAPFADNWVTWLPELQKHQRLRQYQQFGQDVVRLAGEAENVDDFADDLESKVMQLRKFRETKTSEERKESFDRIQRNLEESHLGTGINGLPTGLDDLDYTLSGLRPGQLFTIASRPGMGKSTIVANNIALNLAVNLEVPVALFSLEMASDEINSKMSASMSDVNLHSFYSHLYSKEEREAAMKRMAENNPKLYGAPIMIEPRSDITINGIRAQARRMVHRHDVKLIIVDYLQLVGTNHRHGNRVVEVGQISRGLKSMAMELEVPVIACAQLNRQIENDGNRAPRLADLRESGSIESDSDIVGFIYCEDFGIADKDRLLCQFLIAKNRSGRLNQFDLCFHRSFGRFEDWRQHQDLVAMRDVPEEKPKWSKKSG